MPPLPHTAPRAHAPSHTYARLYSTLAGLTLLLFTLACATLHQGLAWSGGCVSASFLDNGSWLEPLPLSSGAAQAA